MEGDAVQSERIKTNRERIINLETKLSNEFQKVWNKIDGNGNPKDSIIGRISGLEGDMKAFKTTLSTQNKMLGTLIILIIGEIIVKFVF